MVKKKEKEKRVSTEIKGVSLIFKKDVMVPLKIRKRTAANFYGLAVKYKRLEKNEEENKKRKKELKNPILKIAEMLSGLRGLESVKDNLRLIVYPTEHIQYNREPLQESLGIVYDSVVKEDLILTITLTADIDKDFILQKLRKTLKKNYETLVVEETILRVDEEKLNQMVEKGQVKLLDDAKIVDTTWNIKTSSLEKEKS